MKIVRVHFSSPRNISVQGSADVEVDDEDLEDGKVPESLIDAIWQEAVNEYMSDTYTDVLDKE